MTRPLTADYVRSVLNYDPGTGEFKWKIRPRDMFSTQRAQSIWNARFAGVIAGHVSQQGYRLIDILGAPKRAHKIAWLLMTGSNPDTDIDHINQDKADNRWSNLRLATRSQNMANTGLRSTNTTGIKGVRWLSQRRKWCARITVDRREIHLGVFDTIDDAANAYATASRKYFGCFHDNASSRPLTFAELAEVSAGDVFIRHAHINQFDKKTFVPSERWQIVEIGPVINLGNGCFKRDVQMKHSPTDLGSTYTSIYGGTRGHARHFIIFRNRNRRKAA